MTIAADIAQPAVRFAKALDRVAAGELAPYLGPGLVALGEPAIPTSPEALAAAMHARAPLPARLRSNPWGAAQFIEQRRHRRTLVAMMADIFKAGAEPTEAHRALARLAPPLVVDTWYDGAMARALAEAGASFCMVQGVTRALESRDVWTRVYRADGRELPAEAADDFPTVVYQPHGAATPAGNFLVADSDYVEVLTEIDIQTPIPEVVRRRRASRSFLFLGARFHDQMLRTYARQIAKRSAGGHVAVVALGELTRNETRFLGEIGAEPIDMGVAAAAKFVAEVRS